MKRRSLHFWIIAHMMTKITECEGGEVIIISDDTSADGIYIKVTIPEVHWCDRCKDLNTRVKELKDRWSKKPPKQLTDA